MFKKILMGVSFLAATFISTAILAEDAAIADPAHYTVEFENDKVRIIRVKYGPGEKSVMHSHGPNVSVLLSEGAMRMTFPDGTSQDMLTNAGVAQWEDGIVHLPENLTDKPLEAVLIELKD